MNKVQISVRTGRAWPLLIACVLAWSLQLGGFAHAAANPIDASQPTPAEAQELAGIKPPLLQLGPGDTIKIDVYGQPDMSGTVYVSDDGSIPVALAGPVQVAGLSPAEASARIEKALRDGKYLVDPHVTLAVVQSRSQLVSVLGDVTKPGRYAIESNLSILDLLAEAGGVTTAGGDTAFILRPQPNGKMTRLRIDLKTLAAAGGSAADPSLRGGDTVFVPKAPQFYIYGEVTAPGEFKIEPGMTVIQAIARAGGLTPRGSQRRVVIKRRKPDGGYETTKAELSELIRPDDVIRVKESIF